MTPLRVHDASLRRAFLQGVVWTGGARWATQLVTWASTLLVARLLSAEDYGLVGMAAVFLGAITILAELGIGVTVLTLKDLSPRQLAELNGLAVIAGVAAFITTLAAAPLVAAFFARPSLIPTLAALALGLLLAGARHVPAALLQRDLRFSALAGVDAGQATVAAAVTLLCAAAGARHWALVGGVVSGQAAATVVALALRRHPVAWPSLVNLGEALTFTLRQLTGTACWYVYSNADFAVAGRLLGARDLGIYTMAWTVARIVPERLAHIVTRVTPGFLAALHDDLASLRRWIYALTEALALVTFPLLAGLVVVADDAVPVVLGSQWQPAVLPLRILAIYSAWDILTQVLTRSLIAVRDARFAARVGLSLAISMPVAFIVGSQWGLPGLAAAWLIVNPAVRVVILLRARRRLDLSVRRWIASIWPGVSASFLVMAAVVLVGPAIADHPPALRLVEQIVTGGVAYVAALRLLHRNRVTAWRAEWRRLRGTDCVPADSATA